MIIIISCVRLGRKERDRKTSLQRLFSYILFINNFRAFFIMFSGDKAVECGHLYELFSLAGGSLLRAALLSNQLRSLSPAQRRACSVHVRVLTVCACSKRERRRESGCRAVHCGIAELKPAEVVTIECSLQIQMHCGILQYTILGYKNAHYTFGHQFKMAEPPFSTLHQRIGWISDAAPVFADQLIHEKCACTVQFTVYSLGIQQTLLIQSDLQYAGNTHHYNKYKIICQYMLKNNKIVRPRT